MYQITYSQVQQDYQPHSHRLYEIIYVLEGEVQVFIRSNAYLAHSGDLIFLNQLEEHATTISKTPYKRYYLLLAPEQMDLLIRDSCLLSVFKSHGEAFPYVISTREQRQIFDLIFARLHALDAETDSYHLSRAKLLLQLLMQETYALCPGAFKQPVLCSNIPIWTVQDLLDKEFAQPFSLQELSKKYHVSPGNLSRSFKELIGLTPQQYVVQSRLTLACTLLSETDLSVGEIALQSGFGDVNNFIRRFRLQYKVTPRQYRTRQSVSPDHPWIGKHIRD